MMSVVRDIYKHQAPALHIKARSDGMFVVFDKDQKLRYKAPTREAAQAWIANELALRQPRRQVEAA